MTQRHAEIVGAGFAGLTVATALRNYGWSVTVHERSSEVRAHGSALALSENALKVLEMLGAYDAAVVGAFPLFNRETRDQDHRLISAYNWKTEDSSLRMFMLLRERVIKALEQAARRAGVEIITNSEVVDTNPSGSVILKDGSERRADLVVAADGAGCRNQVRKRQLKMHKLFEDGSIRMLLPLRDKFDWPEGTFVEYWHKNRRAMLVPCSENDYYLGLIPKRSDTVGCQAPINVDSWCDTFPQLEPFLRNITEQERWSWDQYQTIILKQWYEGRVAIVGDAAHGMSPNFGQGAALAMVNALALATHTAKSKNIEQALQKWDASERSLIEKTQRLSGLYSSLMSWPAFLRNPALSKMGKSRWIMRQRTLASYYVPTGYNPGTKIAKQS